MEEKIGEVCNIRKTVCMRRRVTEEGGEGELQSRHCQEKQQRETQTLKTYRNLQKTYRTPEETYEN